MEIQESAGDMLWGAALIGEAIGLRQRQAFHLLEAGLLASPRRIGRMWCVSRESLIRELTSQPEADDPLSAIESLRAEGLSVRAIARKLGISKSSVGSKIKALNPSDTPTIKRIAIVSRSDGGPVEIPLTPVQRLNRLLAEVASENGMTVKDLQCESRQMRLVRARDIFCYRAATETRSSIVRIAAAVHRDHTTAIASIRRHCAVNDLPLPRGMVERGQRYHHYGQWPQNRVRELRRLRDQGLQNKEIAEKLGTTKGAVAGAIARFGLPMRKWSW
jgi:predicted transcriptional regulator